MSLACPPGGLNAVDPRHAQIHENDIGSFLSDKPNCLLAVFRATDELDVGQQPEQLLPVSPVSMGHANVTAEVVRFGRVDVPELRSEPGRRWLLEDLRERAAG